MKLIMLENLSLKTVECENDLDVCFSVYALWQHVDLIPYMVTAPPVFEKISRGAGKSLFSFCFSP